MSATAQEIADAHRGYMAICRYVLNFLNGVVKDDPAALAFASRSSDENGMDPGLVQMTIAPGADIPTEEGFVEILERSGIDSAEQVLRDAESGHPHLDVIQERLLNQFGYGYLNRNRPRLAAAVFQLNSAAHPRSANTFDSLGEVYLVFGDTTQAISALERVIELLPSDDSLSPDAKERIRRRVSLTLRLLERPQ